MIHFVPVTQIIQGHPQVQMKNCLKKNVVFLIKYTIIISWRMEK